MPNQEDNNTTNQEIERLKKETQANDESLAEF